MRASLLLMARARRPVSGRGQAVAARQIIYKDGNMNGNEAAGDGIQSVKVAFFSPTGTGKAVAQAIAQGMGPAETEVGV